ncbi:hypothetical protein ACFFWC_13745 [Plantactinospora siamensis]|uniref:Uncharacterized protein n=1 Tax=Plantactinospora siamensis TaxID=555372 RepID=A0ABV6P2G0_9ACTN
MLRNLALVCVAELGLAGAAAPGSLELPYALVAGVAGLVVGVLVTAAEDIAALLRPVA